MCFSYGGCVGKQQVHFDDLAVSRGGVADAVVVNGEFTADGVQLIANLLSGSRVGVVE